MSLVKVRNVGDRAYRLPHAERGDAVIPPDEERIVDLDVVLVNLGNPAATNRGQAVSDRLRDAEVARIQTIWGYYPGLMSDDAWLGVGIDKLTDKECGPFVPQLECYDLNDNRMWMIHDDPTGEHRTDTVTARVNEHTSGQAVENEIQALKDQIRQLTDIMAAQQTAAAGAEPSPAPEPGSVEAQIAAAIEGTTESQATRNEQRDDIPKPAADEQVRRDRPRTPRSGSRT